MICSLHSPAPGSALATHMFPNPNVLPSQHPVVNRTTTESHHLSILLMQPLNPGCGNEATQCAICCTLMNLMIQRIPGEPLLGISFRRLSFISLGTFSLDSLNIPLGPRGHKFGGIGHLLSRNIHLGNCNSFSGDPVHYYHSTGNILSGFVKYPTGTPWS